MNKLPESWKRIASEEVADCRIFRVRQDICRRESDDYEASFYCLENPDWVNIIGLTPNKEVILIKQYRHGIEKITLEIPGGMVDDGEDAQTAAYRELLEETGFSSNEFILLGKSHPNPAINNNLVHHFLALDCEKIQETSFDEHESVVTKLVSLDNVAGLIENGAITHSLVIAAFLWLRLKK